MEQLVSVTGTTYFYVKDPLELGPIAREIEQASIIAVDIETVGFNPLTGRIRLFSVNTGSHIYVIDLFYTKTLGPIVYVLHNPLELTGPGHPIVVWQNGKYDQKWILYYFGMECWPVFDTWRAAELITNGKRGPEGKKIGNNLWDLCFRELGLRAQVQDLGGSDWSGELQKPQLDYGADDVDKLPNLRSVLREKLVKLNLSQVALIEFGSILPEAAVELNGFRLDKKMWLDVALYQAKRKLQLQTELLRELPNPRKQLSLFDIALDIEMARTRHEARLEKLIEEVGEGPYGEDYYKRLGELLVEISETKSKNFNLSSPKDILSSLKMLGIRPVRVDKFQGTEEESTSEMVLAQYAAQYPVIEKIIEFRDAGHQLSAFGPEYLAHISSVTGRIHADYYPMLTSGRFAHSNPNLGQIPRDKRYRKCFRPDEGCGFKITDYSNVEMRIIAEISGDPVLARIFAADSSKREGDAHYMTASIIAETALDKVTKDQRQQAKPVNFGLCLAEGTLVTTRLGNLPIEHVWVGLEVWTHRDRWQPVTALQRIWAVQGTLRITLATGCQVVCTADHPWWVHHVQEGGQVWSRVWIKAADLREGMFLVPVVSVGGQLGTNHRGKEYPTHERIVKIEIDPTPMWVRDLTVQEDHSFVANGLITHNCYGMSAEKLVLYALANYKVKLSLREAQRFRQRYFEAYSGVAAWHRRALDEGKRTRITRSIANRLRYLDENAHNEILNTPVQATGADILKTALREVYIRLKRLCGISGPLCRTVVAPLPKVMVVHHVHDELIEEYDLSDSEFGKAVGDATKEGMEAAGRRYLRNIPVIADPGQGESWADK